MRRALFLPFVLLLLGGSQPGPDPSPPAAGPRAAGPPELAVRAPTTLEPGSAAAVHVELSEPLTAIASRPLAGASITLLFGGIEKPLVSATTDAAGLADLRFTVPALPDGPRALRLTAEAGAWRGERELNVSLVRRGQVLLVSDKPLYQPGQTIELRALGLTEQAGTPLAGEALFELEDARGYKLHKEKVALSKFGVASSRLKLADELNLGTWTARVTIAGAGKELAAATRTVEVKRYSLPKFKLGATAPVRSARPAEKVVLEVDARYFFGKPVAGKVELVAKLDGAERERQSAKLSAAGTHRFELRAPEPGGDEGTLELEVAVTDGADHVEKTTATVTIAKQPLRVALVPEAGQLRPRLPNRIYAVVTTPDGAPARAHVELEYAGQKVSGQADATGIAVLELRPGDGAAGLAPAAPHRPGKGRRRQAIFGDDAGWSAGVAARVVARTDAGDRAEVTQQLTVASGPISVLVRPARVLATAGEKLEVEVLSDDPGPAVLELWKGAQLVATRSVALAGGVGRTSLELPDVSGTLELRGVVTAPHAAGEDARVLHVAPRRELHVAIDPDRATYAPGDEARVRFKVTSAGRGVAAALGVVAVDESVYALQDVQPGMERAFFSVAAQLARPSFWEGRPVPTDLAQAVREGDRSAMRERLVRVLLAAAQPAASPAQAISPQRDRAALLQAQRASLPGALPACGCLVRTRDGWRYQEGPAKAVAKLVSLGYFGVAFTKDAFGRPWDDASLLATFPELAPARLAALHDSQMLPSIWMQLAQWFSQKPSRLDLPGDKMWRAAVAELGLDGYQDVGGKPYTWAYLQTLPGFSRRELAFAANGQRGQAATGALGNWAGNAYDGRGNLRYWNEGLQAYDLPEDAFARARREGYLTGKQDLDFWGTPFRLERLSRGDPAAPDPAFRFVRLVSAGPDREAGSDDDQELTARKTFGGYRRLLAHLNPGLSEAELQRLLRDPLGYGSGLIGALGLGGIGPGGGGMLAPAVAGMAAMEDRAGRDKSKEAEAPRATAAPARGSEPEVAKKTASTPRKEAPVTRVREWFPETLLFQPQLLTDEQGEATLPVRVADSITTWRLTAQASAADGSLGSGALPLRVFQDFFVDLDLPPTLTQGDEVAVPVSVYNYLPGAQRIRLTLEGDPGLSLLGAAEQILDIGAGEVKGTRFRVKATRPGPRVFALTARGEKKSDAVRRTVTVEPDGREVQQVVNRSLGGGGSFEFEIPPEAIAEASQISFKVFPGVVAQVAEGVEGLLQAPGG